MDSNQKFWLCVVSLAAATFLGLITVLCHYADQETELKLRLVSEGKLTAMEADCLFTSSSSTKSAICAALFAGEKK